MRAKIILDRDELRRLLKAERAAGRKVVFTNGCFDILHLGHVRYLREAGRLGDVLVVGVNSDRSAGRLKPGRPVVPEAQRAEVVSALEMVDYVTVFGEDTPYELIRLLAPDVLVKGGDWAPGDIVGSDLVPETYSLPYLEGISTSAIIERIRRLG
ncbi:MAG: adenylyltransferase/cytidyltransferase family protein [Nitrospirota bacterium]|jgi:rfaE bifunctional protein nucleotidyltransferase chain/domain